MRGRKPKPLEVRRLEGNPGKRALDASRMPQFDRALPRCPTHLNERARREWRRVVHELHNAGVVTKIDRTILAMYCTVYGRWENAEEMIAEQGAVITGAKGGVSQNPWLWTANRALEQLRRYLTELGMTPSARSRITAVGAPQQLTLADELFGMIE